VSGVNENPTDWEDMQENQWEARAGSRSVTGQRIGRAGGGSSDWAVKSKPAATKISGDLGIGMGGWLQC
jgi:hypothetical protein